MANTTVGKNFESIFKKYWLETFPDSFVFRLRDQMTGYKETSQNPCDFLCFLQKNNGMLFMIECKGHKGMSISFDAIPQYERLLEYKDIEGVYPVIIIWFYEKDKVIAVPIKEAEKMVKNGEKSIGLRMFKEKLYNIIEIPSTKKRIYMSSDYSILLELGNQNKGE